MTLLEKEVSQVYQRRLVYRPYYRLSSSLVPPPSTHRAHPSHSLLVWALICHVTCPPSPPPFIISTPGQALCQAGDAEMS